MYQLDVEKYPRIKKRLQAVVGEKTDLKQFAVFELLANDTTPITKAGGRLKNAQMTQGYLQQMASQIQNNLYVPLIELHDQNGRLPVGRVIDAAVFDNRTQPNEKDLHLIVYLEASHTHASKISTGIINEVSTGTTPKAVTCSACGYNFMANDESRQRLYKGEDYTPLCSEGHQWGRNGVHLKLSELNDWRETSIVTRGAAPNARVLSEGQVRLASENEQINLSLTTDSDTLQLSTTLDADFTGSGFPSGKTPNNGPNKSENSMPEIQLAAEKYDALVGAKALLDVTQTNLTAAVTAKTEAEAAKATAEADLAAEKAAKALVDADLAAEKAAKALVDADLTAANAKLAIYENGGKPEGSADGAQKTGGEGDNANLSTHTLPDSFYKV